MSYHFCWLNLVKRCIFAGEQPGVPANSPHFSTKKNRLRWWHRQRQGPERILHKVLRPAGTTWARTQAEMGPRWGHIRVDGFQTSHKGSWKAFRPQTLWTCGCCQQKMRSRQNGDDAVKLRKVELNNLHVDKETHIPSRCITWWEGRQSLHECEHLKLYETAKLLLASGEEFAQDPFRLLLVLSQSKTGEMFMRMVIVTTKWVRV